MNYYDDAYYALNANIASQNSMLVDLRYRYNRLLSKILTLGPENVSDDLVNEQLGLVNSIKEKRQTISMLEAELTTFTPMQEPEVILQQILQQEQVSQQVEQVTETVPPAPAAQTETVGQQVSEEVSTTTN
jgi:hypothetical protein